MAIKVGGTSIIDDNKNISNVGIVTIGGSTSGTLEVGNNTGIGITATGDGTLSIAATFYAFDVVTPLKLLGFTPADSSSGAAVDTNILVTFNNAIAIGSTGFVHIQNKNGLIESFGVSSPKISIVEGGRSLQINPTNNFAKSLIGVANTITTVISSGFIKDKNTGTNFVGVNTTGSNITYKFETETVAVGEPYEGGYLICSAGGNLWIAATINTEVSRNWAARNDASTRAQTVSGCTGWFVPNCAQLNNPGVVCKTKWDAYSATCYWSSSAFGNGHVWVYDFANDGLRSSSNIPGLNGAILCVRAFRCVTY